MTTYLLTRSAKDGQNPPRPTLPPLPRERVTSLLQNRASFAALPTKDEKTLTPSHSAAKLHPKFRSQSQVHIPHFQNLMKKTLMDDARPTESQEERRSLFSFPLPSPRRLHVATRFSLGIALALLILSLPDACAQPFTERNPAQDFNTLGVAGGNKGPQGVFGIDGIMLVSDVNGRIYSYDLASKERQDSPHNDRVNNSLTGENNADDFILFKSGTSGPTIRPFGLWANGATNGATLWVAHKPLGPKVREEIKLYAYSMTWETNGTKRYLKGTRDSNKDFEDLFDNRNQDPTGIWSDGETMWVADNADNILYAYDMETKRRDTSKNIDLVRDDDTQSAYDYSVDRNTFPQGIWSDGETMWVANVAGRNDSDEKRIYAYNMWTNTLAGVRMFDGSYISAEDSAKDYKTLNENWNEEGSTGIESPDNDRPRGIWSDGETMWVADDAADKIYAYNLATKSMNSARDCQHERRRFIQILLVGGRHQHVGIVI